MRKSILTLMSIVALFVTSCVQADVDGVQTIGDEAVVSLNVATAASSSRTIADGEKATKLQYAVYDENWNHIYTAEAVTLVDRKATLELSLLTGSTYNFAFWADADKGYYTPDFPNKKVSVSYTGAEANDENRDAFYGILTVEVKGTTQASVDLKRPFAQVNFGTSDLDRAEALGFDVNDYTTKFTVSTYETLNFVDGSVEDAVEVTFAAKAPQTETATLTAGGKNYTWIAMNYVLCPEADTSLSVCTMEATDGTKNFKVEYPMAPARRNWKTNLVGTLFTDSTKVEVEVTPGTGGDNTEVVVKATVTTAQELKDALEGDANLIELGNDIDLNDLLASVRSVADPTFVVKKQLTLNLNNYKLSATSKNTGKNYNMFDVNGGDLTISNGSIECKHEGENMGWNNSTNIFNVTAGGVLTLKDVTAKNLGGSDMAFVAHLNNWGEVTLNVESSTLESTYIAVRAFNSGYDMNNVTIKNSTLKGKYCFWVHNYKAAGDSAGTDETLNVDIYGNGNTFEYTGMAPVLYGFNEPIYEVAVKNATELNAAIEAGYQVALDGDVVLENGVTIANGKNVVLKLYNNTLSAVDNSTGSYGLITNKGNLSIVGPGKLQLSATNNRAWNAYSSVISNTVGGNLVLDGGVVIEHLGGTDMAYGIDNLTNGKGTSAVTTVKEATVKSTYRAIRQFLNGVEATNELYVKAGAVVEGTNKSIWMQDPSKNANTGKLVVEAGAQLKGNVYLYVCEGSTEWPVEVSIASAALVDGSTVLNGNVPAGYQVVEENGVWTVIEPTSVSNAAELESALKAGGNILLANDIALSAPIQIDGKTFSLNGNGHKIGQDSAYPLEGTSTTALLHPIGCTATIENVLFDGLKGDGPIRTVDTKLALNNVTVTNCERTATGSTAQGLFRLHGESTVTNCTLKNNVCPMGISLNWDGENNLPQAVTGCVFENNTCHATAVVYYVKGAGATINGNKFVGNIVTVTSGSNAATLYMGFTENNVITNNLFQNNTVNAGTSKRVAGGIMIGYAATITGNAFIGNTVNGENAKGNDVCASVYYTDIDLSGNYWGGSAPVENENYFVEYPDNHSVIINDYLTENPIK